MPARVLLIFVYQFLSLSSSFGYLWHIPVVECTGDEELLVTNLGIKNYKAATVGVTKFSPLQDKVLEEIGKEIKRELKNYLKDPTNTYKYRGE